MLKFDRPAILTQKAILFLLLLATASCHTFDANFKTQENLNLSVEAFNNEFESKALNSSSRFVHPAHRSQYIGKSLEMTERITFFEATKLDVNFFKDEEPAVMTSEGPEEGFNRTLITIRYQIAVRPSTKLKTLLVEQEWVLVGEQWVVIPDLSLLLE